MTTHEPLPTEPGVWTQRRTPLGATIRTIDAPEHLGPGILLELGMADPSDPRRSEVYLDPDTLAGLLSDLLARTYLVDTGLTDAEHAMTDPTDDTPDLARAVEALADEWESDYPSHVAACNRQPDEWWRDLRAVLDKHRPDRATQPTEAALTDDEPLVDWSDPETWPQAAIHVLNERTERAYESGRRNGVSDYVQAGKDTAADQALEALNCQRCSTLLDMDAPEWCDTPTNHAARTQPTAEPRTVETDERAALAADLLTFRVKAEGDGRLYCDPDGYWPMWDADDEEPAAIADHLLAAGWTRVPARADDPTGGAE